MSPKLLIEILSDYSQSAVLVDEGVLYDDMLLTEAYGQQTGRNTHLDHVEDMILRHGAEGFHSVFQSLSAVHDYLEGRRPKDFKLTTKFDGSPAIIWGRYPENGKFFVGTKSVFNKVPKLNFTPADIDKNHANSESLRNKLKLLLKELPKITPKTGVFQGDLMYTSDDVADNDKALSFTPNTITYKVDKNSAEGKRVLKSKIGLVPHTRYEQMNDGTMRAFFDIDMSVFGKSDDVNLIDPVVKGKMEYSTTDRKSVIMNIKKAHKLNQELAASGTYDAIQHHNNLLMGYMNEALKTKHDPSAVGYISFLNRQYKKHMERVKQEKTKTLIRQELDNEIKNVMDNKEHLEKVFQLHKAIADAKNTMVNVLSKNSPWQEEILGNPSKPEGFVATVKGQPTKFVDRQHFSTANFDWNQKVNPEYNPTVLSWGRFNPPTIGHGKLLAKGADIARRIGAKQITVTSRSQDPDKNPLPPAVKLKWLKTMFPGQNVSVASSQATTLIAQLQQLSTQGVKDLTIVAGDDRIPEYQHILAKYNGKLFNFNRVRVLSAGERDPDAEGATGMSASKMRAAAKGADFKTFKSGLTPNVSDIQAKEMFHTLRADMGAVKIDHTTDGHALSIYSKRRDRIGIEARNEIQNRKRLGTWHGRDLPIS